MSVYTRFLATANRLITKYGKPAKLVTITTSGPDYNPTTTETKRDIVAVDTGYSLTHRDASLIQQGDKLGIMKADAVPDPADKLEIDGRRYSFVDVKPLAPGPTVMLYEFHARG